MHEPRVHTPLCARTSHSSGQGLLIGVPAGSLRPPPQPRIETSGVLDTVEGCEGNHFSFGGSTDGCTAKGVPPPPQTRGNHAVMYTRRRPVRTVSAVSCNRYAPQLGGWQLVPNAYANAFTFRAYALSPYVHSMRPTQVAVSKPANQTSSGFEATSDAPG